MKTSMLDTTRRQFLVGLIGTAAVAAIPNTASLLEPVSVDWIAAINKVFEQYMSDAICYGTAAIGTSDVYPYVRNIPHKEWLLIPELQRSAGEY